MKRSQSSFEPRDSSRLFGVAGPQPVIDVVLLALVVGGYALERRRLQGEVMA